MLKLKKKLFKNEVGKKWLTNGVVHDRHGFGSQLVNAGTLKIFTRRLDIFMEEDHRWYFVYKMCLV